MAHRNPADRAAQLREYNSRSDVKERKRDWISVRRQDPNARERERERGRGYDRKRRANHDAKAKKNEREREYRQRPEVKERRRQALVEYRKRPEVLARKREQGRDYMRRPDIKARQRLKRYGITAEEWATLFEDQGRACAVCGVNEPGAQGWNTDHCHETDRVRGILCGRCNITLGAIGDTVAALRLWAPAAEAYLAKSFAATFERVLPLEIGKSKGG